jgi:hypothetical protein
MHSILPKPEVPEEILTDAVRRSAYSIISLAFKEDNKWRLNDGSNAISVSIDDADFLQKVDNNQASFSKGDILICDVRVIQRQTDSGLRTEYIVERVVERRPAARQLPLPFDEGHPPGSANDGNPVDMAARTTSAPGSGQGTPVAGT